MVHWSYESKHGWSNLFSNSGNNCDLNQRIPGLWSVPMTFLLSPVDGTPYSSTDPQGDPDFLMSLLQYNFKIHWANRLPFGVYIRGAWFLSDPTRINTLNAFFAWARSYTQNAVYFITPGKLVKWVQNPVPLSGMPSWNELQCDWEFGASSKKGEICNGLDDNLSKYTYNLQSSCNLILIVIDGVIDEHLTSYCNLGTYFSNTCAHCPKVAPSGKAGHRLFCLV